MTILNLFSYPSSFGKAVIYKCDFFGNKLTKSRSCYIDGFNVDIEQRVVDDAILFGSFNQQNMFFIGNRNISISTKMKFANHLSGILDPAVDLLFNLAMWTYQGTTASYKFSLSQVSATTLSYNETLPMDGIGINNLNINMFKYYLVNETNSVQLTVTSIDTSGQTISYNSTTVPDNCWLEIFKYGNLDTLTAFPVRYEPMFRMDTSEGSFYPCMIDKMDIDITGEFIDIKCNISCINYDPSTRYDFINSTQAINVLPPFFPMHKSRVSIKDYDNDITEDFDLTTLSTIDYMNGLITQSFSKSPVLSLSVNIDNGLRPLYNNKYQFMKRTYNSGFFSELKTIKGEMSTLTLRSAQPSFNRFPTLAGVRGKSLSILFGNQIFTIPYTVWSPGKLQLNIGNYAQNNFKWDALAKDRQGQPDFELYGGLI